MSTASSRTVVGRMTLLLGAHVLTWWSAVAMVIVIFGILLYRLLAERARRKTLESTYHYAPAGTIVVQGEGPQCHLVEHDRGWARRSLPTGGPRLNSPSNLF